MELKGTNRIISAFLALCMIVSVLPSIAIFDAKAASGDLYFDFVKGNAGDTTTAYAKTITYGMTTAGSEDEINTSIVSEPWAIKNVSSGVDGGGGYFAYMSAGVGPYLYAKKTESVDQNSAQILLKVTEEGTYIPQLNLKGSKNFGHETIFTATLYEYDADTDELGEVIATRDIMYPTAEQAGDYVSLTNTPVEMAKGEYVLKMSTYVNCIGTFIVDGFKLADASDAIGAELTLGQGEGLYTIKIGDSVSVPLSVIMSDESKADLSKTTFEYSVEDVVTAEVKDGAVLLTAGDAAGTTVLTVRHGAAMARANIKVVEAYETPRNLTYNFVKPIANAKNYKKHFNQRYVELITFANTTSGAYGEIETATASDPWAFYDTTATGQGNNYIKYANTDNRGLYLYTRGLNARFKVIVPHDGMYSPSVVLRGTNPNAEFYFYEYDPATDTVGKNVFKKLGVGATDGGPTNVSLTDGPIALKKGTYILRYGLSTTKSETVILNAFDLKYEGEITADLYLTAQEKATMEIGDSIDVPLNLTMGDESAVDYSKISVEKTTFDTEGVVTATEVVDESSAKVTFASTAIGETNATITVKYGDKITKTVNVAVTVTPRAEDIITASTSEGLVTIEEDKSTYVPIKVVDASGADAPGESLSATVTFDTADIATAEVSKEEGFGVRFTGLKEGSTNATIEVTNGKSTSSVTVKIDVVESGVIKVRDLHYNFLKGYNSKYALDNDKGYVKTITYAMTEQGSPSEINKNIYSDAWAYHSDDSASHNDGNNYFRYNYSNYGLCKSRKNYGALKIRVPVSGTYLPFAVMYSISVDTDVKLSKLAQDGSIGEVIAETTFKVGEVPDKNADYPIGNQPIYLEAGEYVVSIHNAAKSGTSIINGFKLYNNETFLRVNSDTAVANAIKGVGTDVKFTVKDANGETVSASDITTSVEFAAEDIASASVGKDGDAVKVTFTGIAIGSTKATVTFTTADGKKGSALIPVNVSSDFNLDVTLGIPDQMEVGTTKEFTVVAKKTPVGSTQGIDASVTVTATSSNTNIIKSTVTAGEGGINNKIIVEGKTAGAAAITVKVVCEDVTKTFQIPILITDKTKNTTKSYKYLLHKNLPYSTAGFDIYTVDSFMDTLPGTALRAGDTDNWRVYDYAPGNTFIKQYDAYGSVFDGGIGDWFSLEIRLPRSGTYEVVAQLTDYCLTGITRVYLAPKGAENPRDPKWSLGTRDSYLGEDTSKYVGQVNTTLRTVDLEAGDYIATFEVVGRNSASTTSSPRIMLDGLYLNAKSEIPQVTITPVSQSTTLRKYTKALVELKGSASDGSIDDLYGMDIDVTATNANIVSVKPYANKNKMYLEIEGLNVGTTDLTIDAYLRGVKRASFTQSVTVKDESILTDLKLGLKLNTIANYINLNATNPDKNVDDVTVSLLDENGDIISDEAIAVQEYSISYASSDPSVASVDQKGHLTGYKIGKTEITVTVTLSGTTVSKSFTLDVISSGKTRSSFYTAERVAAMRENAKLYDWANSSMRSYVKAAETYVGEEERLWNAVTSQELPRSYYVGFRGDPKSGFCRYCGADIGEIYGSDWNCWLRDPWNKPWKVTCPECRKSFPSNDFEKFYALGLDEQGFWRYEKAKEENQKLVDAGQAGYLVNELHPEKGEGWGVDDGYGYQVPGGKFIDSKGETIQETHTYISFYNHWGVWHGGLMNDSMDALMNAYLYTGDAKYARTGAILLDRIADVYPEMRIGPYRHFETDGGHYAPRGKVVDHVWENQLARMWVESYDAFWPIYDDEYVVNFLSNKAAKYNQENPKSTPTLLRTHIEDNILRHIFEEIKVAQIQGNFGMSQSTLTSVAVVLDTMPETKEMLDFVYQNGEEIKDEQNMTCAVTGGNVLRQLIDAVDANGVSDEIAPNYSVIWVNGVAKVARYTAGYDKYPEGDLYKNPRFVKMFTWYMDTFLRRSKMPAIGDSGATGADGDYDVPTFYLIPAYTETKDVRLAQVLYFMNGNKVEGLHYDATIRNPNSIQEDISATIREYGEYDFDKSTNLTDFGFAALRSGSLYGSGTNVRDTQRAFWMYYGRGAGHGHYDTLNLGIEAHGFDMAPDLGYPDAATGDNYAGWGQTTVIHNTVVVDDKPQSRVRSTGIPFHFDDSGRVMLMDAEAKRQYKSDEYRRTVVTVDIDEEDTYAIDFFHVKGGKEHVYSFHSYSNTITETVGLDFVPQDGGTYAGTDIPFGQQTTVKNGYNYLYDVSRDADVSGGNFSVDFKVEDFRDYYEQDPDTHLKMTMVNDFDLSEVAVASGRPPVREGNPNELKWILARRSGETALNTLFTTVFEPYLNESKIANIETVSVTRADGKAIGTDEIVKAVKVTLKDGRIDYVALTKDNTVEYNIGGVYNMKGYVSVYTVKNGKNIYSYVNDGSKVGDLEGLGAATGTVVDFTKTIEFENYLTINLDQNVAPETLIGQYVYVDKEGTGNATYEILDVISKNGNTYKLDIGDITLIDKTGDDGDYVYAVEEGRSLRIPLSLVKDTAPVIEKIPDQTTEAGTEFTYQIKATNANKYYLVSGPSGITVDENTGKLTWVVQASHRGTHAVTVKAENEDFEATETFSITVFNGSSPGGGGGGGGGDSKLTVKFETNGGSTVASQAVAKGALATKPEDPTKEGYTFDGWYLDAELTNKYDFNTQVNAALTLYAKWVKAEGKKFTDLGNHKWAEDAIYRLVEAGVVNGTSATTYSPGVNITRADFTTLIVRAFKFEAEVATFADVDASKYYAEPIGIAKTLGIVGGVNATDFAPTAQITRQDMMVIIYRALKVAGTEIEKTVDVSFADADAVASYAKEAVEALTGAGLIAGSNGKINPKNNTTRAEVAVVLDRILNK